MKLALPIMTLLVVALSGCSGERANDDADTTTAAAAPADQAADDVPPATAPPVPAPEQKVPASPAPGDGAISFVGFGPAKFGANEETVRMAWGKDIKADTPAEPGGCYYLFPQPRPQGGYGVGFMMEGDKFSRVDVDSADVAAPDGGRKGMTADEIRKLYAGRIEEQAHKYGDGQYLRIKDSAGGNGVLIFETDEAGKVTDWRMGVPPQVDYVEGCS